VHTYIREGDTGHRTQNEGQRTEDKQPPHHLTIPNPSLITYQLENKVFSIPYILDTAGYLPGVRTHSSHLEVNDNMVLVREIQRMRIRTLFRHTRKLYICREGT
jgi:hypothetical protein